MIFENWVTDTYSNASLASAVRRHSGLANLKKFHKALHMADSMVRGETVVDIVVGKLGSFGDTLMLITNERVLLLKNSFQAGNSVSLDLSALDQAKLVSLPIWGNTLLIDGYRFSRIPAPFTHTLRSLLTAELANHWAHAA